MTAPDAVRPRRGLRFEHAHFRAQVPGVPVSDSPPEVCKVTQVRQGTVYYRSGDGTGNRWTVRVEQFAKKVARVLPDIPEEGSR